MQVIEIAVKVEPLTADQAALVEKFRTAVENATKAVRSLADNATLTFKVGDKEYSITGKELKAIWATADFTINPKDYDGYADKQSLPGLIFLPLHELGHTTQAGRDYDVDLRRDGLTPDEEKARERMANDVARAIADAGGLATMTTTDSTFYSNIPMSFSTPPADPGTGGGPDDGGGGVNERMP